MRLLSKGPTGTHAYRPDIDGLRALAVCAVLVFHAFPDALPGGFAGVDLFFVISGYLITGILAQGHAAGSFSLAGFYARRVRRIFPALALVLTGTYAIGWFVLTAEEYKELGKHIWAGAGFLSNWVLWREAGYFDHAANTKPLLHLWSLAVEEQFYLFWPLVLGLALRWPRRGRLCSAAGPVVLRQCVDDPRRCCGHVFPAPDPVLGNARWRTAGAGTGRAAAGRAPGRPAVGGRTGAVRRGLRSAAA